MDYGHDYWGWDPNGDSGSGSTGSNFMQFPKAGYPLANNPYISGLTNSIAIAEAQSPNGYIEACGDYVTALLTHLKSDPELSQIKYFEIWNEPNDHDSAETFFPVLQLLYQKVKAVEPDAYVVGGAVCMGWNWAKQLMSLGGWKYMDALSYHYPDRDAFITGVQDFQAYVRQVSANQDGYGPDGKTLPVWYSEYGWSTWTGPGGYTDQQTAAYDAQSAIEHRAYYDPNLNPAIFRYTLQNYEDGNNSSNVYQMGVSLQEGPYTPKLSLVAVNAVSWLLGGSTAESKFDEIQGNELVQGVRLYTFTKDGSRIAVIWATDSDTQISLDLHTNNFTVYDGYGNPASCAPTGTVLSLTASIMPTYWTRRIGPPTVWAISRKWTANGPTWQANPRKSIQAGSAPLWRCG